MISVDNFSPDRGLSGSKVSIKGSNFTKATQVLINGTGAPFQILSDTEILAVIPAGFASGNIAVVTPAGVAVSHNNFTTIEIIPPPPLEYGAPYPGAPYAGAPGAPYAPVAPGTPGVPGAPFPGVPGTPGAPYPVPVPGNPYPATLAIFTPPSGLVGTSVTITGSGFTGAKSVSFGGIIAGMFTVVSDNMITATVPVGAATGPLTVDTLSGGTVSVGTFNIAP